MKDLCDLIDPDDLEPGEEERPAELEAALAHAKGA